MGFVLFGSLMLSLAYFCIFSALIFFFGILPIIIGKSLLKKSKHRKLGAFLRTFGFIVLILCVVIGVLRALVLFGVIKKMRFM